MSVDVNPNGFDTAVTESLRAAVEHVLDCEARDGEISLTLVDDEEITRLNQEYLGHDRPTDVIAFTLGEADRLVGDIYVCVDQAKRQAADLEVPLDEELARLAIHGTLHVLGYDHPEGEDRLASPMFLLQERLLAETLNPGGQAD